MCQKSPIDFFGLQAQSAASNATTLNNLINQNSAIAEFGMKSILLNTLGYDSHYQIF